MTEDKEDPNQNATLEANSSSPPFLEVFCKSSGETRRFAPGTDAAFAVSVINRRLKDDSPLALHVEAVKEGEEPISFGPNSVLTDYDNSWKLQTVTESDFAVARKVTEAEHRRKHVPPVKSFEGSHSAKRVSKPIISLWYIAKIVLAFIFIFFLGAIFTIALDNLPILISFINT